MITDNSGTSLPEATIALASGDRTTSGLLEAIEGAHTAGRDRVDSHHSHAQDYKTRRFARADQQGGITLLSSATLNETLEQIVSLVFEAVPADRCLIMMRDEGSEDLRCGGAAA